MTRKERVGRTIALGMVLVLGVSSVSAQQRSFRHEVSLSDGFTFSQGSQDIRIEGHLADGEAGSAVAFGDFDGDGRLDVAQAERNSNEVHLFFGRQILDPNDVDPSDPNTAYVVTLNSGITADRPDVTIFLDPSGNDTTAELGFSLAVGNVNGDNDPNTALPLQDLLIGAPFDDFAGNDAGRVFVVRGRSRASWPSSLDVEADASTSEIRALTNGADYLLGFSVAAGDFTGDGVDDIAASSRHATLPLYGAIPTTFGNGAVHIVAGPLGGGDVDLSAGGSARHITGVDDSDFLGEYLEFCNVTGGSTEALLIGAIGVDNVGAADAGAMFVFGGPSIASIATGAGSAAPASSADSRIIGRDSEDSLGFSVACGDFNGDGRGDPTAGAFFASGAGNQVSGGGEVHVFYGAAAIGGPPGSALPSVINLQDPNSRFGVRILPSTAGDQLGYSVAYGNMDCDPNSPDELIIGARRYDPQNTGTLAVSVNAGAGYVVRGAVRPPMTLIDLGRGTYNPASPGVRPGNFPMEPLGGQDNSPATPPPAPCDPMSPNDPNNACAVMAVMLGTVAHSQAGYAAAAGDFNGDGCDEAAIGAIGDLTRIGGFRGRVYVATIADNDADQVSDLSDNDDDNDCLQDDDESNAAMGSPIITDPLLTDSDMDGVQDGTELGVTSGIVRKSVVFAGADCSTIDPAAPQCCLDADAGGTTTDPSDDDSDGDNLLEGQEDLDANGAIEGDTDGDGNADAGEIFAETDPSDPDTDGDGIDDDLETLGGCPSPLDADSDDDGLPDGCIGPCGNPQNGESLNGDAVVDAGETDLCSPDSDSDGLQDGTELGVTALVPGPNGQDDTGSAEDGTDPGLFLPDLAPASTTDPLDTDSDDDCIPDGCIASLGACPPGDPNLPVLQGEDVNLNGRLDGTIRVGAAGTGTSASPGAETDPGAADTDGDLLPDGLEWGVGTAGCAAMSPATSSTGNADADATSTTDPRDGDTDDGGVLDGTEDQSATGALNGARDFDPLTFVCDPNGNFLLDTDNETDPRVGADDRGASFSRAPSPAFADPNNTLVQTYIQDDSVVVILLDTDENSDPAAVDSFLMDPSALVDPSDPTLVKGFGCIPDDPNTVFNRDVEPVTLTEIDPNTGTPALSSGLFRGSIPLSTLAGGAGALNLCTENDRVRFGYGDPDDLCDQRVIVADVTLAQISDVTPDDGDVLTATVMGVEALFEQDIACGSVTATSFTVTGTMGAAAPDPNVPVTCVADPNQPARGSRLATLNFPAGLPDDLYSASLSCAPGPGITDRNGFPADCESACMAPPGNLGYCAGAISGDGTAGGVFDFSFTVDSDNSPTVASISPANGGLVDPNQPGLDTVTATFSEAMNAATVDPNTMGVAGTMMALTPLLDPNTGSVPYDANGKRLTFKSTGGILPDDRYTVAIQDSLTDLAGNALDGDDDGNAGTDFGSTFVVDYDQVPSASPVVPGNGAVTGNAATDIVLAFDQAMEESTVEDPNRWTIAGTMMAVAPQSITYDPVLKRVTFDPSGSLPDDLYTITFSGPTDHAGNVLDGDGNGMAGGAYVATFVVDADSTPTAAANSPAASSVVMSSITSVDVVFSESIDPATVDANTFNVSGASVGTLTCDFTTVPYNPATKLSTCTVTAPLPLPQDTYTVTLSGDPSPANSSIRDFAGNPIDPDNDPNTPAADTSYTFSIDLAPVVFQMSPPPDADVAMGPLTALAWTFDQAMDVARLDAAHMSVTGTSGPRSCDSILSATDPNTLRTTATCTIAAGFTDDLYTVTLDGSSGSPIRDAGGFGKALDGECPGGADPARCEAAEIDPNSGSTSGDGTPGGDYVATFLVDTAAPSVANVDPNDGFLSPAVVTLVTITFSEAMNASRFDPNTISIVDVSDPNNELVLDGVVAYDPNGLSATFDPNIDIGNGLYELRLQSSDPNTGIADVAGNLLTGGDFISGFTVQSSATLRLEMVDPGVNQVIGVTSISNNDLDGDFDNNLESGSVNSRTYFMLNSTSVFGDPNTYEPCNPARRGGANKDKIDCDGVSSTLVDDRYTVFIRSQAADPNVRIFALGDPTNYLDGESPCTVSCPGRLSGNGFPGGDFVYSFFIDVDKVPAVTGTVPAAASIVTDPNAAGQIAVTFDQRMDPNTFVPGTTVTLVGDNVGTITITVAFDPATRVATITPSTVPLADDDYTLTLLSNPAGDAVRDHSFLDPNTMPFGNALDGDNNAAAGGDFVLSFTVDTDQIPAVTALRPPPGSTSAMPIASVDVIFDQVMDVATITTGTFTITGSVAGAMSADSVSFDPNGFTASFNRGAGFPDDSYLIVLDADGSGTDVADLQGNRLDGECTGGVDPNSCEASEVDPNVFQTSGDGTAGGNFRATFVQDADMFPNVTSVTPTDGSTSGMAVTSVIFTFDQIMSGATVQDPANLIIVGSDPNVPFACDSGPVATTDPNNLATVLTCNRAAGFPEDTYTVTLNGDPNSAGPAADLAGNPLDGDGNAVAGGDFTSTFTVDLAPLVTGQAPDPNTPSVDPNAVITVTFDQPMNASSVQDPNNWTVAGTLGTVAATAIAYDPNTFTATFDPSTALPDDSYTVTVDGDPNGPSFVTDATGNALDGDGNGAQGGDFGFTFNMDADMQPQVIGFSPSLDPNMPGVDPNVSIVVAFDQAMGESVVEDPGNWLLFDAADPNMAGIPGSIIWDPIGFTATFDPAGALPDAVYRVRLAGVADLAGNPLDGRCAGGICDSPAELPTGDPNQVSLDFVAQFEVDAVPITPPPVFEPVLEVSQSGVLLWTPQPAPPGGTAPLFNLYRGDMIAFALSGIYTQDPAQVPEAMVECAIADSSFDDGFSPAEGSVAFYLVAEVVGGVEGPLGSDSSGAGRTSEGLCGAVTTVQSTGGGGGAILPTLLQDRSAERE